MTHIPPKPRPQMIAARGTSPGGIKLPANPLEPARRAGATLLVLGIVALLVGIFLIVSPVDPSQMSVSTMQLMNAAGLLVAGAAGVLLGLAVRGGKHVPALLGLLLAVLAGIYLIIVGVADVRHNKSVGDLVFLGAIFVALIVLMRWLWQSARIAPHLQAVRRRQGLAPRPPGGDAP